LILIAAMVVGVLAVVVVWNYVNGADNRAQDNAAEVPVYVVKRDIPRGATGATSIDQKDIVQDTIPTKFKPNTAVNDLSTISTFVAVTDIPANSVLVNGMFVSPEEANVGNSELLKDGRVAITISVDPVRGVAGLIVPGDFVNVMLLPKDDACATPTQDAGSNTSPPKLFDMRSAPVQSEYVCRPARFLYQKVQVLFVDKTTVTQPGQTQTTDTTGAATSTTAVNTGLITLSVPPSSAQWLASVNAEQLYLTLVAPDYTAAAQQQIDTSHVTALPGEDAGQLTPYGPAGLSGD
jgi:Flp pilus assembly protein CpaB